MIKNDRQFKVTRTQIERLKTALNDLETRTDVEPLRYQLEADTLAGQIAELERELADYTALRDGRTTVGSPTTLDELPGLLIRQRIASNLTQRELAERLGMKEQQIQRYEANEWQTASLSRLTEVAEALGLELSDAGSTDASPIDEDRFTKVLAEVGIDRDFLERRLRPQLADELAGIFDLTARLQRIYGWSPSEVLAGDVEPDRYPASMARFKLPVRHHERRTRAYTVYSHYLALLTIDATRDLDSEPLPQDPYEFRDLVLNRAGRLDFDSVLDTSWSLGVPVLPLADPGVFHAVLWRSQGRNVVILKQGTRSASRWLFDLLHELRHATEHLEDADYAVVEDEDTDPDAEGERVANRFAGDVLLDGQAEELAQQAVDMAGNAVERLKGVVPLVAEDNDVEVADLANYLAYRLSLQGIDWWGAATNLEDRTRDPFELARRRYLAECDVQRLAPLDRDLLLQALTEET